MAKRLFPIAIEAIVREAVHGDGRILLEILSPRVGWYYLSPEKPDAVTGFVTPYNQVGQEVRPGEIICRIRTLTRERRVKWRWLPFFRTVVQDFSVTSPVRGVLCERTVEREHVKVRTVASLGNREYSTLTVPIPVEYGEILLTLHPIN